MMLLRQLKMPLYVPCCYRNETCQRFINACLFSLHIIIFDFRSSFRQNRTLWQVSKWVCPLSDHICCPDTHRESSKTDSSPLHELFTTMKSASKLLLFLLLFFAVISVCLTVTTGLSAGGVYSATHFAQKSNLPPLEDSGGGDGDGTSLHVQHDFNNPIAMQQQSMPSLLFSQPVSSSEASFSKPVKSKHSYWHFCFFCLPLMIITMINNINSILFPDCFYH